MEEPYGEGEATLFQPRQNPVKNPVTNCSAPQNWDTVPKNSPAMVPALPAVRLRRTRILRARRPNPSKVLKRTGQNHHGWREHADVQL